MVTNSYKKVVKLANELNDLGLSTIQYNNTIVIDIDSLNKSEFTLAFLDGYFQLSKETRVKLIGVDIDSRVIKYHVQ